MQLLDVVQRLDKAKAKIGGYNGCRAFEACCPAHDDKNPSFMVWEGKDGWLHFNCQAGCGEDAILASLHMSQEDRRVSDSKSAPVRQITAVYDYRLEDGTYVFSKVRMEPGKDGRKKDFLQGVRSVGFEPRDKKGYDYKAIAALGLGAKILYNLPGVAAERAKGGTIHVHEGEKAVDYLNSLGMVSTCQPGGAHKDDPQKFWLGTHTEALNGFSKAIVWADRDDVGEAFAKYVASELYKVIDEVIVMQSATTGEHDDAVDHFKAGKLLEEAVRRTDLEPASPLDGLICYTQAEFEPVKLDYLWEPYIPVGKIILADGDGGVGKTSLATACAACFSHGITPITFEPCRVVRTLMVAHGEDGSDEIETVFRACQGKPGFMTYDQSGVTFNDAGILHLRSVIKKGKFGFVVFDGLFDFLQGLKADSKDPVDAAAVMGKLQRLAAEVNVPFWVSRHVGKDSTGKALSNLGMGSAMIRNKARGQLLLQWHRDKAAYPGVVVVQDLRGSILRQSGRPFAFRRRYDALEWMPSIDLSDYEQDAPTGSDMGRTPSQSNKAGLHLEKLLTDRAGVPAGEAVKLVMALAGCSQATVYRAKEKLGVVDKLGFWFMPGDDRDMFAEE